MVTPQDAENRILLTPLARAGRRAQDRPADGPAAAGPPARPQHLPPPPHRLRHARRGLHLRRCHHRSVGHSGVRRHTLHLRQRPPPPHRLWRPRRRRRRRGHRRRRRRWHRRRLPISHSVASCLYIVSRRRRTSSPWTPSSLNSRPVLRTRLQSFDGGGAQRARAQPELRSWPRLWTRIGPAAVRIACALQCGLGESTRGGGEVRRVASEAGPLSRLLRFDPWRMTPCWYCPGTRRLGYAAESLAADSDDGGGAIL